MYPSVLHGLLKYYGDTGTAADHWSSLTRFVDNEYSRIVAGGVTAMFVNFGVTGLQHPGIIALIVAGGWTGLGSSTTSKEGQHAVLIHLLFPE